MKKILISALMIVMCLFVMTGCEDTSAADAELRNQLYGCWVLINETDGSLIYNDDGTFVVYEFTPDKNSIFHEVYDNIVSSHNVGTFEIVDGKYKVTLFDGTSSLARIEFRDGKLYWFYDQSYNVFQQLTEADTMQLGIPTYNPEVTEIDINELDASAADNTDNTDN